MGTTLINWADWTKNFAFGCDPLGRGCENCYAARLAGTRLRHLPRYKGLAKGTEWTGEVRIDMTDVDGLLTTRTPKRVFINSMGDTFHHKVPDEVLLHLWSVMARTPHITYLLLTKRHDRMKSFTNRLAFATPTAEERSTYGTARVPYLLPSARANAALGAARPLPNVWLGVSVENQEAANLRVPALLAANAAVHWVSAEPLVGPVDLRRIQHRADGPIIDALAGDVMTTDGEIYAAAPSCLDWVVIGGESGKLAAPMHPDWAGSLIAQCEKTGRAPWFKQWGEWGPAPWEVERQAGESDDAYKKRAEAEGATHAVQPLGHVYEPPHRPWSTERTSLPAPAAAMRRWGVKRSGEEFAGREIKKLPHDAALAVSRG